MPPPFTSFEAVGLPPDILREVWIFVFGYLAIEDLDYLIYYLSSIYEFFS